jgi:serine/threonine protein kinase
MDNYSGAAQIGKGAHGVVYAVTKEKKRVALKVIFDVRFSSQTYADLRSEILVCERLSGLKGFCQLRDCFQNADKPGMVVMEFDLHVCDLARYLNHESFQLTPLRVHNWIQQLSSALGHMHRLNIIHRDIKPENILLSNEDKLVIGDFGLAKLDAHAGETHSGYVVTRWYRPPEVLLRRSYCKKIDVWSMGCIMWEIRHCLETRQFVRFAAGDCSPQSPDKRGDISNTQLLAIFRRIGTPEPAVVEQLGLPPELRAMVLSTYYPSNYVIKEVYVNKLRPYLELLPANRLAFDGALACCKLKPRYRAPYIIDRAGPLFQMIRFK